MGVKSSVNEEERLIRLSSAVRTILECLGENLDREGLLKKPERYARSMLSFTKGYHEELRTVVNDAVFRETYDGMVIVKDIEFFSFCKHHLIPFCGKVRPTALYPLVCHRPISLARYALANFQIIKLLVFPRLLELWKRSHVDFRFKSALQHK